MYNFLNGLFTSFCFEKVASVWEDEFVEKKKNVGIIFIDIFYADFHTDSGAFEELDACHTRKMSAKSSRLSTKNCIHSLTVDEIDFYYCLFLQPREISMTMILHRFVQGKSVFFPTYSNLTRLTLFLTLPSINSPGNFI